MRDRWMTGKTPRQQLGRESERKAAQWLVSQGYVIERTNVRYPVGEIDILAWERDTLCFIEVRSTRSDRWGGALATIREGKRRRLILAARCYLQGLRELPPEIRFDVVAVCWPEGEAPSMELIRGAFTADIA